MTTLSLNIDARGAQKGAKDFKRATDQVKTSAMQADSAVEQMGTSVARTSRGMSGRTTFIFQNTANQLGDIAVQASMGTNMFRVLGMQLPQIAGGFALLGGSLGVVAPILGVIAAIGFPILATFTAMSGSAKSVTDRINDLSNALDLVKQNQKLANASVRNLRASYGMLAEDIKIAHEAAAEFDLYNALRDARQLRSQMTEAFSATKALGNEALILFQDLAPTFKEMGLTMDEMTNLTALMDTFGLSLDDAVELQKAVQGINESATDDALAQSLLQFSTLLNTINKNADEPNRKMKEMATNALEAGTDIAELVSLMSREPLRIKVKPRLGLSGYDEITAEDAEKAKLQVLKILQRRQRQEEIEALKDSKTAAKEFKAELDKINLAMSDVQSAADMVGNSFENAFMSAVDGSMSAKDAFRSMAVNIISELYRIFVVKKITGFISSFIADPTMFGGLGGGGAVTGPLIRPTSFDGGGYTGNGPRTGGLDGRGGFMAMLHPNETVVDHSRGNSGGEVVVNQTINVTTGVQQTVRTEIQTLLPQIAEASKAAVLDARRRGGSFANAF